jgi:hypothetical protein
MSEKNCCEDIPNHQLQLTPYGAPEHGVGRIKNSATAKEKRYECDLLTDGHGYSFL